MPKIYTIKKGTRIWPVVLHQPTTSTWDRILINDFRSTMTLYEGRLQLSTMHDWHTMELIHAWDDYNANEDFDWWLVRLTKDHTFWGFSVTKENIVTTEL